MSRALIQRRPKFVSEKRGPLLLHASGTLAQDLLRGIGDPDHLFELPGCEVIKDQRKIKVARVKIEIHENVRTIYLKRFNAFSWRYRIGSLFQSSGGLRSLKGAAILSESGIRTARPLAAVDSRSWGVLDKSFFLSEEIENGKTADRYWREELQTIKGKEGVRRRRRFLRKMGDLFGSLHRQDVYHNDLKDANILVSPDSTGCSEHFYLLDLEGIRRYRKLNWRRRIKNLVQLNRTLGNYLRATDKLRLLESYLGPSFSDRSEKRSWVSKVVQQSRRLDRLRKSKGA